LTKKK
jgi:hypothetical protein